MTSRNGENGEKNIADYDGADKVVSAHEIALTFKERDNFTINVKSGIPQLDYYCEGFREGELITISGKTKTGKLYWRNHLQITFPSPSSAFVVFL